MRMIRPSLILKTVSGFQMRMIRPSLISKMVSVFQMRMIRPSLILNTGFSLLSAVAGVAGQRSGCCRFDLLKNMTPGVWGIPPMVNSRGCENLPAVKSLGPLSVRRCSPRAVSEARPAGGEAALIYQ